MKHLKKDELLRQLKHTANVRRKAASAPFTGMATLGNYVLWKMEGWYQKRLVEYNQRVRHYYDSDPDIKALSDRLFEKSGIIS